MLTFLVAATRSALALLQYKIYAKRHPLDIGGIEALENGFLPILRSTHVRRYATVLAIAGVPRMILPAFLKTTAEEYWREAADYRAQPANTSELLNEHLNCFIGDSHAEFYSRAYALERSHKLWDPIAFWLGSKTLLGFVSASSRRQLMDRLESELAPFLRSNVLGRRSIALCWTLGSIDVRSSFQEIMIRSAIEDSAEVVALFEKTLAGFVEDVVLAFEGKVARDCPGVVIRSFFISAICPTIAEIEVRTVKDVMEARKIHSTPTFGSLSDRLSWTRSINAVIERICTAQSVRYYDSSTASSNEDTQHLGSIDQVHLTLPTAIRIMNEQIAITTNAT